MSSDIDDTEDYHSYSDSQMEGKINGSGGGNGGESKGENKTNGGERSLPAYVNMSDVDYGARRERSR